MSSWSMKQNDTWPIVVVTLANRVGGIKVPMDLTDAESVTFQARSSDEAVRITGPCVVEDASEGQVSYAWEDGDTSIAGHYYVEFEIDWGLGRIETVPNDGYVDLNLLEELDE